MRRLMSVLIAGSVLLVPRAWAGEDAVSVSVRPSVAAPGGNARVQVLVSRHELNRALVWEIEGPNYYRLSSMELHGAASARAYSFVVRRLPAGTFEIRATVRRNDDSEFVDRSTILVAGRTD